METCEILGVNIAVTSMDEVVSYINNETEGLRGEYICVSNVHTTVTAYEDSNYKRIQNGAAIALPDGAPLSAYQRKHGFYEAKRVTGPDLMKELLKIPGKSHFFYGASEETLEKLKVVLEKSYPNAKIAGMISPPFRELTKEEDEEYVKLINEALPDFLWVGLGAPKQEIWMADHKGIVKALMIGVGAAFDYEAGNIKRAPKWMQRLSLEWLFRLLQDPVRLFKRYLITNTKYLFLTRK